MATLENAYLIDKASPQDAPAMYGARPGLNMQPNDAQPLSLLVNNPGEFEIGRDWSWLATHNKCVPVLRRLPATPLRWRE